MGAEVSCTALVDGRRVLGTALLETDELRFRADGTRLKIPLASIRSIEARAGALIVAHGERDETRFELGEHAVKWLERIQHPKGRLDKLGVKPGQRVALIGIDDPQFATELRARAITLHEGRPKAEVDQIFLGVSSPADLNRLVTLQTMIARDGAIWVVRDKGKGAKVSEAQSMAAGKAAGLVDVKVVRFSDGKTAEKYMIPVARR